MARTYFTACTLDDLMRQVVQAILHGGCPIRPTKGPAKELTSVLLKIRNPRARISRTETRGKPYSCLGELCWYLARADDLEFIAYYIPAYRSYADGDHVHGAYGPRLFSWNNINQFDNIKTLLTQKPDSRQAVVQLFDAEDLIQPHSDIPCTCALQFMIRKRRLHMLATMRSNDVYLGLPHDIFCFTMLQEILARTLAVEMGTYTHVVGSLHLYDLNLREAEQFLDEGWQSTKITMPHMPPGDPWPAIDYVLTAESSLRTGTPAPTPVLGHIHPYWADLIRLLQVFRARKDRDPSRIISLKQSMSSDVYSPFINNTLVKLGAR